MEIIIATMVATGTIMAATMVAIVATIISAIGISSTEIKARPAFRWATMQTKQMINRHHSRRLLRKHHRPLLLAQVSSKHMCYFFFIFSAIFMTATHFNICCLISFHFLWQTSKRCWHKLIFLPADHPLTPKAYG